MDNSLGEITTLEQFEDLLLPQDAEADGSDGKELDISTLRYALYARRSTKGKDSQERSIPDQVADCRDLQKRQELNVVKIWKEKESAKEPDIREKFRDMIDDLWADKYDAILCYHPDRLARNMKEGGEIIDLIDRGVIKHIAFCTYTFENTPTGKMLLGISFVLSKQYADAMSVNIRRGQRRSLSEGKYLVALVHGYSKHEGRFFPDGNNFRLIKKAFEMRLEGYTNAQIADFLNQSHYQASRKGKPVDFKMDKKRVGEFLKNPVYIGVAVFGEKWLNLTKLYDFEPMIEVSDFIKINSLKGDFSMIGSKFLMSQRNRNKQEIEADFLRNMVICANCTEPFHNGITTKKDKKTKEITGARYYYRCETKGCEMYNKSVRPKIVLDFVYDFLEKHHFDTQEAYQNYRDDMTLYVRDENKDDQEAINHLQRVLVQQKKTFKNTKDRIKSGDAVLAEFLAGDLPQAQADIESTQNQIAWHEQRKQERSGVTLTYEQYLELYGNVSVRLRKIKDYDLKQEIIKKFFLNFTLQGSLSDKNRGITRWELVGYELNEPFAGFVKMGKVRNGGERGIRTLAGDCSPLSI